MLLAAGLISISVSTVAGFAGELDDELGPSIRQLPSAPSTLTDERLELVAVEPQRAVVIAIALDGQRRAHPRPLDAEVEIELDLGHQPVGRPIILAPDRDMGGRRRRFGDGLGVGERGGANVGHGAGC